MEEAARGAASDRGRTANLLRRAAGDRSQFSQQQTVELHMFFSSSGGAVASMPEPGLGELQPKAQAEKETEDRESGGKDHRSLSLSSSGERTQNRETKGFHGQECNPSTLSIRPAAASKPMRSSLCAIWTCSETGAMH